MKVGFKAVPPHFFGGNTGSALQEAPELQQGTGSVCICQGADKGGSCNLFSSQESFSLGRIVFLFPQAPYSFIFKQSRLKCYYSVFMRHLHHLFPQWFLQCWTGDTALLSWNMRVLFCSSHCPNRDLQSL